jgi:Uma2 family endonuclease
MNLTLNPVNGARVVPMEPLTVQEFWQVGLENPDLRLELEPNGDLLIITPTERGTGFRGSRILRALGDWAEISGKGYEFDSSTAYALADGSVRSPDASFLSKEHWNPEMDDAYDKVIAPDFVIELRSKTDRLSKSRVKMQAWIDNGVQLAWLVDPLRKAVEIYLPGREPEVLEGGSMVEGEGPVAGFVLELGRIWG